MIATSTLHVQRIAYLFFIACCLLLLPGAVAAQGSGNQDTDQDNRINSIDVDDDGDGVLDATERVVADWGNGIWRYPIGALSTSINVRQGVSMSINVANTVPGTFGTSGPISGGGSGRSPREDPGALGAINDVLVVFDPAARGTSPVNIDVAFSVPAYDISFIISDVDGSTQGGRFGTRWDQVEVTYTDRFGNAGLPATIEPNTHAQPVIVGNVAYSRSPTFNANFDNTGNLLIRVPDGATAFRIVYTERGNMVPGFTFSNPSARGIGILGGLAFSPDVDRDGVPDALDTDSDNDGCFDAVEAGIPGIFNNVGVVSDGRLLGCYSGQRPTRRIRRRNSLPQRIQCRRTGPPVYYHSRYGW